MSAAKSFKVCAQGDIKQSRWRQESFGTWRRVTWHTSTNFSEQLTTLTENDYPEDS